MPSHRPHSFWPRRRFAWLLWLGLLLPVAQVAAACHALTHVRAAIRGDIEDKGAPHADHCDLCLAAAAIAGGAAIAEPPVFVPASVRHEAPHAETASVWLALPVLAYLSRAPPLVSL